MQMDRDLAANLRPFFLSSTACSRDKGEPMIHEEFTRMSNLAGRRESDPSKKSKDQDQGKGAVEQDQDNQGGNTSMNGQLGHRDENAELKNADSDLSG